MSNTPMTYQQRKFWTKVFLTLAEMDRDVETCAEFADAALAELKKRDPEEPEEDRRFHRRARRGINPPSEKLQ